MDLQTALEESRALGFLGPGAVEEHISHAQALIPILERIVARSLDGDVRLLDLGSGGGVPGLVLAEALPSMDTVLLDGATRRTDFLDRVVRAMALPSCSVVAARAEVAGRDPLLRGTFDLVVARSFGAPAVVAECAAPFLRPGGHLVVSEPPGSSGDRWPRSGVRKAGLELDGLIGAAPTFAVLHLEVDCPDELPRRVGVPSRRPLF